MPPHRTVVDTAHGPTTAATPTQAAEGLARLDRDGRVEFMNALCLRMFGAADLDAIAGRPLRTLMVPAQAPELDAFIARVFTGEPGTLEFELAGTHGTWLAMHATLLPDDRAPRGLLLGIVHDITSRRQADALLHWEKDALELIMGPDPLDAVLERLVVGIERQSPGALCSVLFIDEDRRLRRGAAPSLPAAYSAAIDGVAIGPRVGSCGAAAFHNRQIIVADIAVDPLWADFTALANEHGLRACWSTPIRDAANTAVATFAVYYREPRHPSTLELQLIERAERIVALAIERKTQEARLLESRDRLDLAIDSGRLGVWEWFPRTGRTTRNAAWAQLLDYAPEDVTGDIEFFKAHVHPDDLPRVLESLQAHLDGRSPRYEAQYRLRTRTGDWKWVIDRGRIVRSDTEGPVLVSGVITDVTPLKATEAALAASEQRYQLAVEGSTDGLWDWDMRTNATYFSPRWKGMLGYADDELLNEYATWADLIHEDDRQRTIDALTAHIAGHQPIYGVEFRMRCKDGSYKWILTRGTVLRDERGEPVRMAGSHTDVTERRANEDALRASQAMVEAILDAIPVRLFWKDLDLRYLGCNAAFARDAGFDDPKELVGKDDFAMGWRDDADRYRADDLAVLASGRPALHIEEPQTSPDGATITLLTSKVPLRNAAGEVTGVLGTYLDISQRKLAEEEVRRLNAHLEAAVRDRTEALRHSEAQLRDIFDGTSELIQSVAPDGRILLTNRAWRDTLGYSEAEAASMNIFDVIHPEHRQACAAFFERLKAGDDDSLIETVFVARDGTSRYVEGSVTMGLEDGRPVATRSILRDVTARRAIDLALRESEESYRLMIDSSRDAILTLHPPDWRFASCNPAAVELFGAEHEAQLCQLGPWGVSPEHQPDGTSSSKKALEHIEQALWTGASTFEWIHQRLDGTPFEATVQLSRVVQAGTSYLLATVRDITAQKQAETALKAMNEGLDQLVSQRTGQLRDSEARFRLLVDSSPNAVLMTGPDGRITFANRRTETVLGYRPDELVGESIEVLLPEPLRRRHVGHRAEAWKHTSPRPMGGAGSPFVARRKDGSEVAIEVGLTPIAIGGTGYMMATVTDVTARKVAEDAVKRLAAFPEVNPNPVVELDATGAIAYANHAAEALAHGLGLRAPASMLPDDTASLVQDCLSTGKERRAIEQRFGKRTVSWSFYPIVDRGVVHAYAADITERVALEAQLRQAQKMEAIGQLAGGVAHDFNNILSVVLMQAELSASAEALSTDVRDGLHEIRACAERGADLTRQLLLFSRRQVMQPQHLDLNEVVTTTAKMLQRIIGEDISLELHLHPSRLPVRADSGMLNQVLLNLAVNARDAMPRGGRLRVDTWERALAETDDKPYPDVLPGRYAGLRVSDTGSGIPADVLPRIFEPFFTTKEAGRGTGLGLATVFGIVRQHGGFVNVASEPGLGTSFEICLPETAPPEAAAETPRVRAAVGGTETILVVEDEPAVRHLVRSLLRRRGYTVFEAGNGLEALKLWQEHGDHISLVLTDMVMPDGMSGLDLARRLRAANPGLRVVFSSGYSAEIAGRELKLADGENFLQKPFTSDALLEMVRRAIDARPAA